MKKLIQFLSGICISAPMFLLRNLLLKEDCSSALCCLRSFVLMAFMLFQKSHNIKSFSILRSIVSSITMLCLSQGTQRLRVTARKQNTESAIIRYFRPIKNVAILVKCRLLRKLGLLGYLPVHNNLQSFMILRFHKGFLQIFSQQVAL